MLRTERDGPVATIVLDRPEIGNAIDDALIARFADALAAAAADAAVRVVVLTGAGRVFSAGADLNWMRRMRDAGSEGNRDDARRTQRLFATIAELPKPVVARVNGPARGGGVGLLAAADVVVASAQAHFAFTEVRVGIVPATIAPFVIARVGATRARRLFCTGETFGAADALAWGLVDRVVEPAELDGAVKAVVADLLKGAPGAIAEAKRLVRDLALAEPSGVPALTADLIARLRAAEEGQEGMAAFLDKRPPRWAS
ncbi:MAG TPA: enoyl-CoA hydratase-related protein [Candidatus Binatia bacterium]|nr:enoyl-CoA hydratase-related protein [Candidatus Binatia bacterium]